jgi:site-specific recombinase XerD
MGDTISPARATESDPAGGQPQHLTQGQILAVAGNLLGYVDSFERHLKLRNRAPRTIQSYVETARQFVGFLAERGMPTEGASLRREHVEAYVEWLQAWTKPATVAVRYRSLQQFFRYLVDEGECASHPMERMHVPAVPEQEVPVLDGDEIGKLLGDAKGASFTDRRDLAILRLFLDSGLRLAEMADLRPGDIDLRTNTVFVEMGKGRKPRTAAFGDRTAQALERYLRLRTKHRHAAKDQLWLGPKGPFTASGIGQMVERRSGGTVHPHQLRHTAAHHAASAGMQETDMMRLFGWRSSDMPKRYGASAAGERALDAYKRLGVGDRF